jgi:hypothetical protein
MAAASNKPVALQVSLVIAVVCFIAASIVAYMQWSNNSQIQTQATTAQANEKKVMTQFQTVSNELAALKAQIGLKLERVGDAQDNTTVIGASVAKITQTGPNAGPDFVSTIDKMLAALGATDENRKQVATQLQEMDAKYLALKDEWTAIAQAHDNAKQQAETDKQELIRNRDEQLAAKDQEIGRIQKDLRDREAENANLIEQATKERTRLGNEITRLESINDKIREELDTIKQVSFEVADGLIRKVDNSSRMVWLNIGSADRIQPRITFSVYDRESSGIGRGMEGIKGKIEVTRVIDANMSEAKILEEDLYRPMSAGDQIYSPLWNPGRVENFSFIGIIDIDNDGRDDREQLHQIVATSGAKIDNEVNEKGERIGKGITESTKFLVLGEIPEIADLATDAEKAAVTKINEHLTEMRREARLNGVRLVSLTDFLAYIGYKAKRRLFQPGQERPFNLKAGAHSTAVNESIEQNRDSTGNVSGAILKGSRQKQQDVSPGTTSKLFGTKKGY